MEINKTTLYNITLDEAEVSDIITAIEIVYKSAAEDKKIPDITPLLDLKDALVLSANQN